MKSITDDKELAAAADHEKPVNEAENHWAHDYDREEVQGGALQPNPLTEDENTKMLNDKTSNLLCWTWEETSTDWRHGNHTESSEIGWLSRQCGGQWQ